ncbi:DapH/DapD/GlmU-related protein [Glutamicibacter ardleyensis]|uniref:DapH/DapD/GlmU-related protein n=1 Tax=Glutamicibacter ardleyensis TaxID=225894 RepID=UPI003FD216CA
MNISHKLVKRPNDTLVVTFAGAVKRSSVPLPYFEWARTLDQRTENYLCLSDPTLELDDRLTLGWFIGPCGTNLQKQTAEFIAETARSLHVKKTILVGSSGGGFIAMAVSAHLPGSVAVAFSPTTTIDRVTPGHTRNLIHAAYPELNSFQDLMDTDPEQVSLEHLYASPRPNKVFLIQNSEDLSRLQGSFEPFADSIGLSASGGISPDGRLNLVTQPYGTGHIPPPRDVFNHWIDVAKNSFENDLSARMERLESENTALKLQLSNLEKKVQRLQPKTQAHIPATANIHESANVHPSVIMFSKEHRPIRVGARTRLARGVDMIGPITIGEGCLINVGGFVRPNTTIGNNVLVGPFSRFMSDSHGIGGPKKRAKGTSWPPIVIGDGTWIGSSVTILGGVTVGPGCVIASGAVVTEDIPANSLAGGVPAKVIRSLDEDVLNK